MSRALGHLVGGVARAWTSSLRIRVVVHPALTAERARGVVVPYAAACARSVELSSWDRFALPLPFSRVVVALGAPLAPAGLAPETLALAIDGAADVAARALEGSLAKGGARATVG